MKTRRRHVGSAALLAVLALLPGCGGGETEPEQTSAAGGQPPAPETERPPAATTATVPATPDGASSVAAPEPATTAPDATAADGPQLDFVGLEHDFGTIWDYDRPECRFEFTNSGSEQLVIEAVKAACGCTATTLAKTEYAPGERGVIEVAFTPKGYGSQRKPIDIVSNSTTGAVTRLIVASNIRPFMQFEPKAVRFEQVALGQEHTQVVELISPDPAIEIESVEARIGPGRTDGPRGYLSARVVGVAPSGNHRIEVTLRPDMPWGPSYGEVNVTCRVRTGDGDAGEGDTEIEHIATVGVVATAYGELLADAVMFRLPTVAPGQPLQSLVHLWRPSKRPFSIVSTEVVQSTMPGLTLQAVPIDDGRHVGYDLLFGGPSGDHTGPVRGHVRITTDVPGEEILELRFVGSVSDEAAE